VYFKASLAVYIASTSKTMFFSLCGSFRLGSLFLNTRGEVQASLPWSFLEEKKEQEDVQKPVQNDCRSLSNFDFFNA